MKKSCYNKTRICCCGCGCSGYCCCNSPDTPSTQSFTFRKIDRDSGEGLSGAEFELALDRTVVASAVSREHGTVSFRNIKLGEYVLYETCAPDGYVLDTGTYSVIVHQCGVTINNICAGKFVVSDCKTGTNTYITYYENIDGQPGESLTLDVDTGSRQTLLPNIFENNNEFISWNTDPFFKGRTYYPGDEVTIGCEFILYAAWKSAPPSTNPVAENAQTITGEGNSGSRIDLMLPDSRVESTIVDNDSNWNIKLPPIVNPLAAGMIIKVYQTEFNMFKSDPVVVTVST